MNKQKIFYSSLTYIENLLFSGNEKKHVKLPSRLGEYKFIKRLNTKRDYPFSLGIYTNNTGKLYCAKVWRNKHKNLHYFELKHEAEVNRILTDVEKRLGPKVSKKNQTVRIAPFIELVEKQNILGLIRPYIKGRSLVSWENQRNKTAHYDECVSYLKFLGSKCTGTEIDIISKKSVLNFLFLYPFILLVSILKHPELIGTLLTGTISVLRGSMSLLHTGTQSLIHGDLQTNNILLYRGTMYMFDFEQSIFTYPEYEFITTIANKRNKNDFVQSLLAKLEMDKNSYLSHKGLLVFCLTYNLTNDNLTVSTRRYRQLFRWMLQQSDIEAWTNMPVLV